MDMRTPKYTEQELRSAVATSSSLAEVLKKLGLKQAGGTQENIKNKIEKLRLDVSHFTGKLWSKGKTHQDDDRIKYRFEIDEVFKLGAFVPNRVLRDRVIKNELVPYHCAECLGAEWRGKQLTLELHHINGNTSDNRIENLTFLCPNCHSLTPTFKNRVRTKRLTKVSDVDIVKGVEQSKNLRQLCLVLKLRADGDNYGSLRRRMRMLGLEF